MSDKDSLFGSPPPSPSVRGRSPSLALPELPALRSDAPASSQNVGTIALPGSHERSSELPVFITPALPSERPPALSLRPPAQPARPRAPPKRRVIPSSTSRRTRSPSRHPSPAPHNAQTDRTLRDLVGLISHFEPGALAQKPPPITTAVAPPQAPNPNIELHAPGTAQNPIEIDAPGPADAVNSALVALAGTVASALKLPTTSRDASSLSKPTVTNVLHIIKHDPKLIPILQATYDYLGSVPNQPSNAPRSFSHVTTNNPNPSSKRRRYAVEKGSQVPAGAGHWDVPFPFPPGRGPNNYPSQWHLDRGRRVLGELLGLFERAFAQARGDTTGPRAVPQSGRSRKRRRIRDPGSSAGSARSDIDGSANGASGQGYAPSGSNEASVLDHTRMNEWLSSVPASSAIVESTGVMPSPSPSEPAPPCDSLQDLMAMLGSDTFGNATPADDGDDKDAAYDFTDVFKDAGLGHDDTQWQSLFGPSPTSQSINDIMAFPMGFQEDLAFQPSSLQSQPQPQPPASESHGFVIDPVLMALSQPQQAVPGPSSSMFDGNPSGQTLSVDLDFFPAEKDASTSTIGPTTQSLSGPHISNGGLHFPDQAQESGQGKSLDTPSLFTVPTASASSSQAQSRPGSVAPTDLHTPSATSSASLSKAQRKATLLAKAKEHRAQLLRAIERAKTERWETVIEGGVLRNLQTIGVP